jgi:hypothetical protein
VHAKAFEADDNPVDDPGSPGEIRAMQYARQYFESLGLKTFVQSVPLVQMVPTATAVRLYGPKGGSQDVDVTGANALIWAGQQKEHIAIDSDVVFAGYGIVAPEYNRNDYKNVKVAGRIVIVLEGSPHHGERDDLGVLGETHYGTRFYKFAEAARHGAAAILIIHTDQSMPWEHIRREASGSVIDIDQAAQGSGGDPKTEVEGWLSLPAANRLFGMTGVPFETVVAQALELAFVPVTIPGIRVSLDLTSTVARFHSQDLFAVLPGQSNEYTMLAGRWNRIDPDAWTHDMPPPSAGPPGSPGYEAALARQRAIDLADDDSTGAAMVLETAQRLVAARRQPLRSILFMVTTAMKAGIVGLEYYVAHPPPMYPTERLTALTFIDRADLEGTSRRVGKIGAEADGTLSQITREAAIEQGRLVEIDQDMETRFYYTLSQEVLEARGVRVIYLTTRPEEDVAGKLRHIAEPDQGPKPPVVPPDPSRDAAFFATIMTRVANATNWPPRLMEPAD